MEIKVVDLYEVYGISKPEGAIAKLTCWIQPSVGAFCETRQYPSILILPGGGYSMTSPREAEPIAMAFYSRGYNTFILNYSCAPLRFPTALREAALAMDYIRKNADAFASHPNKIAAIGFSAGAHLCGTLGTMYDCPEVADLVSGNQARPDALALCYPVAVSWGNTHEGSFRNLTGGDEQLRQRLSLDKLVRPDMPPVYLWHTREDSGVPVRNSLVLAAALEETGIPLAMNIYCKGDHGLSLANEQVYGVGNVPPHTKSVETWVDSCIEFFAEQGLVITD
ncbi:MAG: alpha/beta hydrolase [Ruminococcaceae bacterium]|nr:alpha/beta hydrolase [Oscillospiraceae bacterium]